jgi:hypothetical protein
MQRNWQAAGIGPEPVSEGPLIATVEEQITATTVGTLSVVLLLLNHVGMIFALSAANGAIQEAAIGTVWIATNILLATGAVVGRRRTYLVRRTPPEQ